MTTFATVIILAAIATVQGLPANYDSQIAAAAAAGNWQEVQRLFKSSFADTDVFKTLQLSDVKDLKPIQGGHVYGESEYTFHSASNVNGKKIESKGGHKVFNTDGKVIEFDI